ncbi:FASCICLIN-LIKE ARABINOGALACTAN PROTEIN [Salix purpurea]|uniref:FASCICLIN-LIKE ARABINOGALACTAN PROTEIN n=1 Tax=Salix purpurea TaxID=77065 RepID=A0A9Q0P2Z6_SALPP|nr:FASCICLIN-LIKE ARABINOGALACTAN PROTEIN [Salix purpurea]
MPPLPPNPYLKTSTFLYPSHPSSPLLQSFPQSTTTTMPRPLPLLTLAVSLALLASTATVNAHNITRILAKHPQFSTFNHYLTVTHLAAEINRRQTITVLALDNAAMKLHQITNGTEVTATMFQATGSAPGSSGYVNITDLNGGKVAFGAEDSNGKIDAVYVKSLVEIPYNISVLQISQPLNSAEAEAPTAAPTLNVTAIFVKARL